MRVLVACLGLIFASAAMAQGIQGAPPQMQQQQAQQQQSPGLESAALAYRQLGLGIDALAREMQTRDAALHRKIADMDAYLKACGDKPGCTVPVQQGAAK